MPLREGEGGQEQEQEVRVYQQTVRFTTERVAHRAYFRAQEAVFADRQSDLSVYRFLLDRVSHVVVLGTPPSDVLEQRLSKILAAGEPAALPPTIVHMLWERRERARQEGSWVERHYRLGRRL